LTRFGGHSQAAGFTLPTANLARLEQQLSQIATTELAGLDLQPRLDIDAEVGLDELAGDTFQAIQMLAPYGQGNPLPTLLSRNVKVADCRPMGNNGDHLRLKLKQDSIIWDAVAFGLGNIMPKIQTAIDIVYNLELDKWCGEQRLRLNILDLVPKNQT
jgi:single-stranded-DNA-specific exonuclease